MTAFARVTKLLTANCAAMRGNECELVASTGGSLSRTNKNIDMTYLLYNFFDILKGNTTIAGFGNELE